MPAHVREGAGRQRSRRPAAPEGARGARCAVPAGPLSQGRGSLLHVRPRLRAGDLAGASLYHARPPAAGHGVRRLQQHHLRLRPDRERQVVVHDGGWGRPQGHHPAGQRGPLREDRAGGGGHHHPEVPGDVLLLRDLQRDHLRPPGSRAGPRRPWRRPPGEGAPRARHLREGPAGDRGHGLGQAREAHDLGHQESGGQLDADELGQLQVALHLHHQDPPEGRGGQVPERLREAQPRGPGRVRAAEGHRGERSDAQRGRQHQQEPERPWQRDQRPGGERERQEGLRALPEFEAHARAAGVAGGKLPVHDAGDALAGGMQLRGDDVDAPLRQPRQGHQGLGDEERGGLADLETQRRDRGAKEEAARGRRRGRRRRRRSHGGGRARGDAQEVRGADEADADDGEQHVGGEDATECRPGGGLDEGAGRAQAPTRRHPGRVPEAPPPPAGPGRPGALHPVPGGRGPGPAGRPRGRRRGADAADHPRGGREALGLAALRGAAAAVAEDRGVHRRGRRGSEGAADDDARLPGRLRRGLAPLDRGRGGPGLPHGEDGSSASPHQDRDPAPRVRQALRPRGAGPGEGEGVRRRRPPGISRVEGQGKGRDRQRGPGGQRHGREGRGLCVTPGRRRRPGGRRARGALRADPRGRHQNHAAHRAAGAGPQRGALLPGVAGGQRGRGAGAEGRGVRAWRRSQDPGGGAAEVHCGRSGV
mmetsp:Transcript_16209/g.48698  ORF Transcript_16209/g.48698 Transcript_16209/m.48698 type:complete len:705 (-) Transcript_16209:1545-3659(-)